MVTETSQREEDLVMVYQTLFLDLPFAGAKWGWGIGGEKETAEVAWEGYDAWIRWTSASIDSFYRNPFLGAVVARSLDGFLRWQRLNSALAGAFFAGVWQVVGLPGITVEVQTLREESRAGALQGIDTANGGAEAAAQASRKELPPLSAGLLARSKEREAMSADLCEYFEPVDFAANAAPAQSKGREDSTDLREYFEPVDFSTNSAPVYGEEKEIPKEPTVQRDASQAEVKKDGGGVETAKGRVKTRTGQHAAKEKEKERREKDAVAA